MSVIIRGRNDRIVIPWLCWNGSDGFPSQSLPLKVGGVRAARVVAWHCQLIIKQGAHITLIMWVSGMNFTFWMLILSIFWEAPNAWHSYQGAGGCNDEIPIAPNNFSCFKVVIFLIIPYLLFPRFSQKCYLQIIIMVQPIFGKLVCSFVHKG